jgi:hypothetical protein
MKKEQKKRKLLWIEFHRTVNYSVGLEIGNELSLEEAKKVANKIDCATFDFDCNDETYQEYVQPYASKEYEFDWGEIEVDNAYIREA